MLRVHNLRKSFGSTVALDGLSFTIGAGNPGDPSQKRGEVLGLLGPNGAGKSTLIAIATGLLVPDAGTVAIEGSRGNGHGSHGNGGSPASPEARRLLGLAPQRDAIYDELTARENLVFFARMMGMGTSVAKARGVELLELVGLTDRADDRVKAFSGGMRRRLNLAAALVHDPPLLMLDEPTAGVDPHSRLAIYTLVESLRERGRSILYTTHDMAEAQRLCDRVGIIDHGQLLAIGATEDLIRDHGGAARVSVRTRDGHRHVHETDDPMRTLGTLDLSSTSDAADAITSVTIDTPDLESVFLNLTGRHLRD